MNFHTSKKYGKSCYNAISLFLAFLFPITITAQTNASERITIQVSNEPVERVFTEISNQTNLKFFYGESVVNDRLTVNLNFTNSPVQTVLSEITRQTSLQFSQENNTISVSRGQQATPTSSAGDNRIRVTGNVKDDFGEGIIGANVVIKGTALGSTTDLEGNFVLDNVPSNATLQVSFLGMETKEVPVRGNSFLQIQLNESSIMLSEIVAIGYGTARKSDLTGALTSVTADQFEDQRVSRLDQVLQGRASGVQITNTVGAPGGDVRIRIRGVNSVLGDNSPLFVIDGFVGADFNMLNPNDIQSIEVLKDASSTAIYGSRGANGVILVTTKTGNRNNKVTVNYQGDVSFSTVLKKYDMLSAADFAQVVNEKNADFGLAPTFSDADIEKYRINGGFDYQDAIFRTAVSTQHQIGIAGGTEKTQYRISGNYLNQQGIIENSKYERYTIRTNFNTKITDKLSFRFLMNGASMTGLNVQARTGAGTPVVQALAWAPTTDPYDGEGGYTISDPVGSIKTNPLAIIYDQENRNERTFANLMSGLRYEIIDGLNIDFQAGSDIYYRTQKNFSGNYASNYSPSASIYNYKTVNIQTTTQLSYDKVLNDIHRINAVVALETQKNTREESNSNASNLKFAELKYDNLAQAESYAIGSGFNKWTLLSYIGRVNYSLLDRYLLSVSVRRDGSSKFAKDNRFSTFPSVALAWNIRNESFMEPIELFSKLKVRASWGLTGSQAIEPYATLSTYNTGIYYAFTTGDRTSGIQLGDPGNKDLKWETTDQKDFGLEVGFFNGKLNFEFDYFIKDTRDLLLNKSVPFYLGGGSMTANVGKIRNQGWELSMNATPVDSRNISWSTEFNVSKVKNEVRNLGDEKRIFVSPDLNGLNGQPEFVYEVGQPLASFWGLTYLGPWKESEREEAAKYGMKPGDARYLDVNEDGIIDGDDYHIIGNGLPKTTLGWNNTVNVKNFTINAFFQGVFGIDKMNYTRGMALMGERDARQPTLAEIKDRYSASNQNAFLPAYSETSKIEPQSTMFMENASYLRLKNLSIGYNFNVQKVGNIKVSLNATNLFTITSYKGIDPESSNVGGGGSDTVQSVDYGSYPNSRTYTIGIDLTF